MGAPTDDETSQYENSKAYRVADARRHDMFQGRLLVRNVVFAVLTCALLYSSCAVLVNSAVLLPLPQSESLPILHTSCGCPTPTPNVPQYFQTENGLWAGPTATGRAPFLAQTNPVFFAPTATFVPNNPLETSQPIVGQAQNESIFQLMGNLSPYFSNPSGFGVNEYPLPPGAKISQVQVYLKNIAQVPIYELIAIRCSLVTVRDIRLLEAMCRLLVGGLQTIKGNLRRLDLSPS